ncbi:hypothetical protein MHU86_21041 [Fragilaria crotonensis]|nr:hypothetical protein MHU86_21041 [Fragilaria crotonensis]
MNKTRLLRLLLVLVMSPALTLRSPAAPHRRKVLSLGSFFLSSCFLKPNPSQAACLQGDTSPDCIGVYKVPLDDAILPYIQTPEKLAEYAPGVRWVPPMQYPKTYQTAVAELVPLKDRIVALNDLVLKGNLTQVGVELLDILPRVVASGRVVVTSLATAAAKPLAERQREGSMSDLGLRCLRVEDALTEVSAKLYSVDVMIGQTLRGDMGSLTAGQIQILNELREADILFDELLQAIPSDFKASPE